jgi:RNA polymerase sigma-70 factor, ECF subfamily
VTDQEATPVPGFWTRNPASQTSFERETKPFLAALYRTARRLTGQQADAEDLVHDAYLKAFRARPRARLGSPDECRAWLFRILMNTYFDRYRRRLRSPETPAIAWPRDHVATVVEIAPCSRPGPDALLEQKRFALAVESAIACLPPDVRAVVILFFVEGLSYQEIADAMQCPIGTVMSRLWRGRRFLRSRLSEYAHPQRLGLAATARKAAVGRMDSTR